MIEIIARWEVHFNVAEQPTDEEMKLAGYSAAHFAWPYLREYVASVAWRMGTKLQLPLITVHPEHGIVLMTPNGEEV